ARLRCGPTAKSGEIGDGGIRGSNGDYPPSGGCSHRRNRSQPLLEIRAFFVNHFAGVKCIVKVEAFHFADECEAFLLGRRYVSAAVCLFGKEKYDAVNPTVGTLVQSNGGRGHLLLRLLSLERGLGFQLILGETFKRSHIRAEDNDFVIGNWLGQELRSFCL